MQRPIVIRGKRAIIARPPEKLAPLFVKIRSSLCARTREGAISSINFQSCATVP